MQGQLRYSGAISGLRKYSLLASEKRMFWYTTESLQAIEKGEFDRQILERFGSATAIICYNDQMAKHIISLLQRAGKSVPEDISVIGVDDLAPAVTARFNSTRNSRTKARASVCAPKARFCGFQESSRSTRPIIY